MSIQIEEGKFYRTRSGTKVGPIIANIDYFDAPGYPWAVVDAVLVEGLSSSWTSEGVFYATAGGRHADHDIVAEWTDADEVASKELYPFTEVAWTPEDGLTSRKSTPAPSFAWTGVGGLPRDVAVGEWFTDPRGLMRKAMNPLKKDWVPWLDPNDVGAFEYPTSGKTNEQIFAVEARVAAAKNDPYVYTPPEPMRVQILHEGARLTNGERDAEYGPPAVNMAAAGALKAAFRAHMTRDISLAELEAIDMALTKLGRIATGVKPKKDTFVDCATYIAIAGEIALSPK